MAFLALTVVLAGGAWLWSGDPIRALAVLVVATPCPLILAVPVAIVSGVSRAAKAGVLVKGGRALEALARVRVLVIDKTGTLTYGQARIVGIRPVAGFPPERLLQLAASLDQASKHVIARALVQEAQAKRLDLLLPTEVEEVPGEGAGRDRRWPARGRGWNPICLATCSEGRRGVRPTATIRLGRSWWPWRSTANPPGS